jgi:hypothetical protein
MPPPTGSPTTVDPGGSDHAMRSPWVECHDVKGLDAEAMAAWLRQQSDRIATALAAAGAVLLRDTGVRASSDFGRVCQAHTPTLMPYIGGATPRSSLEGLVYTSTEYAAQASIPLHCEATYQRRVPHRIWFFCRVAPTDRGETPLGDMRRVRDRLPVALVDEFRDRGLVYLTNLRGGPGFGKSWQQSYGSEDRGAVEDMLREQGCEWEWRSDGGLLVRMRAPGLRRHSVTGEEIWTNQAVNWHPAHFGGDHVHKLRAAFGDESRFPKTVMFGDGGSIPAATIETIAAALQAEERTFTWRQGDIVLVDNEVIAHGRRPFSGERAIDVAMA